MNGCLNICGNGLSPLRGLFRRGTKPTAYAVGYSLTALRAYETTIITTTTSVDLPAGSQEPRNRPAKAAEQRQRVAHGVSRGCRTRTQHKPRRGERNSKRLDSNWHYALQAVAGCYLLFLITGCGDPKTGNAGMKPANATSITNGITTKVFERDRDQDGRMDYRMETFFRDGRKVLLVTSKLNADGKMAIVSRSYLVDGNMVLIEADENGDGVFETILATNPETNDYEVFTREIDGTAQPASDRVVEAYKKQMSAVEQFFDEALSKDANPDKFEELMRAAQKKIQDAEREKKE